MLEKYEWFCLNLNEKDRSYTILHIDWKTKKMGTIERYVDYDENDVGMIGKAFIDIGEGNFDDDLYIKHQTYNYKFSYSFEEAIIDIKKFPKWQDCRENIIEKILEKKK